MKYSLVPVCPEVELQGLGLDDFFIGSVTNENMGKIGLSRFRTKAAKFAGFQLDQVISFRIAVGESFQSAFWLSASFAEFCQVGVFWIFGIHEKGLSFHFREKGARQ